jgi:thiol-disulfide isomerase/thioredoxin
MLRQVYDSSLKDIPVASLSHTTENAEKTTLGTIASQCKHIIFYIFRSEPTDLLIRLRNMVERKNSSSDTTSTSSSPAKLKKLFGLKKAKKKNSASSLRDISVVLIDLEGTPERTYDEALISDEFYTILPLQYTAKSQLVRALGFTSSPAVTIVRSDDMEIITKQGRRCLMEDEAGKLFPWNDPPADSVFSGSFLQWTPETKQTTSRQFSALTPCVKGLYFGAKWCPPCRAMTQQLTEAYRKIKAKALPFEIFFCSSDRTMASFEDHFSSMPWFAFPFDNEILTTLTRAYNVNGIPTFLIIDEKGEIITRHGRSVLLADPNGDMFPWKKQPLYELTEYTLHRVADNRSLILFTGDRNAQTTSRTMAFRRYTRGQRICQTSASAWHSVDNFLRRRQKFACITRRCASLFHWGRSAMRPCSRDSWLR